MEIGIGLVICLFVIGAAFLVAEIFVPGGVTAVIGVILLLASLYLAFVYVSPAAGVILFLLAVVLVPGIIMSIMRKIRHESSESTAEGYTAVDPSLKDLQGRRGVSVTTLRPSGIAKIEGRRVDVVSFSTMIPADTPVEVIRVEGCRVVVRPIEAPPERASS